MLKLSIASLKIEKLHFATEKLVDNFCKVKSKY